VEDGKATPAVELRCSKIENQIDEAPVEDLEPGSWAVAMFWDGKKRVGRSFPINRQYFSIFGSLYDEDGMCLQSFSNLSDRCRSIIRLVECGITLWRSTDSFWLYNRDNRCVIFAHSIDISSNPIKILPGGCIQIPPECKNLTVSFVKGWGKAYTRQDVTECPAWLEILL